MHKSFLLLISVSMVWVLSGCAGSGPAQVSAYALPDHGALMPTATPALAAPAGDGWWRDFGDETLNGLVEQALSNNFSLHSVRARVERAQAMANRSGDGLVPELQQLGVMERRYQLEAGLWRYSADLALSHESIEAWKELAARVVPADFQLQASRANLSALAIGLSASVARTYFAVVKNHAELRLLQHQLARNQEVLELMHEPSYSTPQPDELFRQRQLVAETEARSIAAEARQQTLTHQLAVLVGAPVADFRLPHRLPDLKALPPLPYRGVPAEWLMRRPDLQAAFFSIQRVSPDLAELVTAHLPSFKLTALVAPTRLLEDWVLGLVSKASGALLGRMNISLETALARTEEAEALANYRHEVLSAAREVEDALVAEHRDRLLLGSIGRRLTLAEDAVVHLRYRYANGVVGYFELYTALRDLQALERERLSMELALSLNRISVAHALAGSWERSGPIIPQMLQSASRSRVLRERGSGGDNAS